MKKNYLPILIAAAVTFLMTACSSTAPSGAQVTENGTFLFSATGQSVADSTDPVSIAKAEIAAATIAKANLLESIKGALISNSVTVNNLMLESQTATATVQGWLSRANVTITRVKPTPTNLPVEKSPMEIITAVAALEVSEADVENLNQFAE
jgi:hypothetical protein